RALASNWFIRGAISLRRSVALRLWCRSHMSQTMIAVARASQAAGFSTARYEPLPAEVSTWARSRRFSLSESAPEIDGAGQSPANPRVTAAASDADQLRP